MQFLRACRVAALVALVNLWGSEAGRLSLHKTSRTKSENSMAVESSSHTALDRKSPVDNLWQSAADVMGDNPMDVLKEEARAMKDRAEKSIMGGISRMRAAMCNDRPNLLTHETCMKFMTSKCMEKSTGEGECKEYEDYLIHHCKEGSDVACDHARRMGLVVGEKKQEEEEKQKEVNITEESAPKTAIPANQTAVDNGTNTSEVANTSEVSVVINASAEAGPTGIDKKLRDLPEHGYNEYGNVSVLHSNQTGTQDWLDERPRPQVETNDEAKYRLCKAQKDTSDWCKLFIRHYEGSSHSRSFSQLLAPSSSLILVLSSVGVLCA